MGQLQEFLKTSLELFVFPKYFSLHKLFEGLDCINLINARYTHNSIVFWLVNTKNLERS